MMISSSRPLHRLPDNAELRDFFCGDRVPVSSLGKTVYDSLDRPLTDLRISVTDRCNFRCMYCRPKNVSVDEQPSCAEWLDFEEIARVAKICGQLGVSKIRITGGEPLLRPGVVDLVRALSVIDGIDDLAMTTNGFFFAEYAEALKGAGLNRVTFSLDTVDPKKFSQITGGRESLDEVFHGLETAERVGLRPLKINAVVVRGINDETVVDFVRYFMDKPYAIRFIEYMDVGTINQWREDEVVLSAELITMIGKNFRLLPLPAERYGETAARYRLRGGRAEVGFISSVSGPFCKSCTRLRLSADGKLYPCLFADRFLDVRTLLRGGATDQELIEEVRNFWAGRTDRYSESRRDVIASGQKREKIEMYRMGG